MRQLAKRNACNPLFLQEKNPIDGIFTKFTLFQIDFARISASKPALDAAFTMKLLTDSSCVSRGSARARRALLQRFFCLCLLALLAGCAGLGLGPASTEVDPPREFRALWVATVANIDWPSRPGLAVAEQRAEMRRIIDTARALRLNALVVQVRPAADAIYPSALEPWSEYLSGTQGVAPGADYDPLAEWVALAHAAGLELHAWFNPYRARHPSARSALAPDHLAQRRPELVVRYGDTLWMDPGAPDAAAHTLAVIADVVRRYDIDGVHIDDYFYPYPVRSEAGGEQPFPDDASWQRYRATAGWFSLRDRADWRRRNVDELVQAIGRTTHAIKPWVKFGVSPFGLGRPDLRPAGIEGFSQYDKLYADVERWWQRGWVDYLAPQLYWPIAQTAQAFPVLLDYWAGANWRGRHLWPGLFTSRIDASEASWQPEEIERQIALLRASGRADGHIHFSAAALVQNRRGVAERLAQTLYRDAALVPATPWLRPPDWQPLAAPALRWHCEGALRCGVDADGAAPAQAATLIVATRRDGRWHWRIVTPSAWRSEGLAIDMNEHGAALEAVALHWLDRYGIAGERRTLTLR